MLARLSIRDIVLIDRLDLCVEAGLLVLTGETGAGKSILLDAFALALGGRGDGGLVRQGQAQGQVTAVFDVAAAHPAWVIAVAAGLEADGDLILRRVQMADGRTRAFVNDQPVSVQTLRAIGHQLVEIHGQHDDRALMEAAEHRTLLDAFGLLTADARDVARLYNVWREAGSRLAQRQAEVAKAKTDQDYLRHAADELSKLGPEAGEEDKLAEDRARMMRAEKATAELREVHDGLAGHASPVPELSNALRRLERRAVESPELAGPAATALEAALISLEEARDGLERALRDADFDPHALERVEERLFGLRAAARKYAVPVDALAALAERYARELAAIDAGEGELKALSEALVAARAAYDAAATHLSGARRMAASELETVVNAELPPLKLERARFIVDMVTDSTNPGAEGNDRAEFHVQTNPGTRAGPMMKVASGGELSRFMLALKVALAERGSAPTLVFDEIDAGVGGAVADAIGQRLARLAARVQVLAVTHAPQVAARAARHLLISKDMASEGNRVVTDVRPLEDGARREEIARMLSGATITDEARAAAVRLLAGA